jgi:hypothetical protein
MPWVKKLILLVGHLCRGHMKGFGYTDFVYRPFIPVTASLLAHRERARINANKSHTNRIRELLVAWRLAGAARLHRTTNNHKTTYNQTPAHGWSPYAV